MITEMVLKEIDDSIQFKSFENGLEAIEVFTEIASNNQELPDVILLDIHMPFMDSWQFLEKFVPLKSQFEKWPFIYITSASFHEDDIEKGTHHEMIERYLIKPLNKKDLTDVVEKGKQIKSQKP